MMNFIQTAETRLDSKEFLNTLMEFEENNGPDYLAIFEVVALLFPIPIILGAFLKRLYAQRKERARAGAKIVKTETSYAKPSPSSATSAPHQRSRCPSIYPRLSTVDRLDIIKNRELADDVIDGAMSLIQIHFPDL